LALAAALQALGDVSIRGWHRERQLPEMAHAGALPQIQLRNGPFWAGLWYEIAEIATKQGERSVDECVRRGRTAKSRHEAGLQQPDWGYL